MPASVLKRAVGYTKVVGKQKYRCFQANGPELFGLNHQSLQTTRNTPKAIPPAHVCGTLKRRGVCVPTLPAQTHSRAPPLSAAAARVQISLAPRHPHPTRCALSFSPFLTLPYPARNKGGSVMDARSQPTGTISGDPPEDCTWPCHPRHPRGPGGLTAPGAGQRGLAGRLGCRAGGWGAEPAGDSPSQRPGCAPRGAEGRRAAAEARS